MATGMTSIRGLDSNLSGRRTFGVTKIVRMVTYQHLDARQRGVGGWPVRIEPYNQT